MRRPARVAAFDAGRAGPERWARGRTLRSGPHGRARLLQPEPGPDRGRQGRGRQDHHGRRTGPPGRRRGALRPGDRARGAGRGGQRVRGQRGPRLRGRGAPCRRGDRPRRRPRRRVGGDPAGNRARPHHHPGRRPPRVPRRPRHAPLLQAAPVVGHHRHRGRGHPRDPGHPGAREDQADRAAAGGRPGPGRRAGHRPHDDLPLVGRRSARRRPGRPHPGAGGRRRGPAVGPRALPGRPGHAARGDAGQRGGRGRLPARGPGGHRPGPGHRQRRLPAGARAGGARRRHPRRRRRDPGPRRRPQALEEARRFRQRRHELQEDQIRRLAEELPLPQLRVPYLFTDAIGPRELDVLSAALGAGIEALHDPAGVAP